MASLLPRIPQSPLRITQQPVAIHHDFTGPEIEIMELLCCFVKLGECQKYSFNNYYSLD